MNGDQQIMVNEHHLSFINVMKRWPFSAVIIFHHRHFFIIVIFSSSSFFLIIIIIFRLHHQFSSSPSFFFVTLYFFTLRPKASKSIYVVNGCSVHLIDINDGRSRTRNGFILGECRFSGTVSRVEAIVPETYGLLSVVRQVFSVPEKPVIMYITRSVPFFSISIDHGFSAAQTAVCRLFLHYLQFIYQET